MGQRRLEFAPGKALVIGAKDDPSTPVCRGRERDQRCVHAYQVMDEQGILAHGGALERVLSSGVRPSQFPRKVGRQQTEKDEVDQRPGRFARTAATYSAGRVCPWIDARNSNG